MDEAVVNQFDVYLTEGKEEFARQLTARNQMTAGKLETVLRSELSGSEAEQPEQVQNRGHI